MCHWELASEADKNSCPQGADILRRKRRKGRRRRGREERRRRRRRADNEQYLVPGRSVGRKMKGLKDRE